MLISINNLEYILMDFSCKSKYFKNHHGETQIFYYFSLTFKEFPEFYFSFSLAKFYDEKCFKLIRIRHKINSSSIEEGKCPFCGFIVHHTMDDLESTCLLLQNNLSNLLKQLLKHQNIRFQMLSLKKYIDFHSHKDFFNYL